MACEQRKKNTDLDVARVSKVRVPNRVAGIRLKNWVPKTTNNDLSHNHKSMI